MPNTFKNASDICTTTPTVIYTCPPTGVLSTIVFLAQASNVTAQADAITFFWTSAANANAVTNLTYQTSVPANQSIGCLTGKLVLLPGDTIKAQCLTVNAIHFSVSLLEMS